MKLLFNDGLLKYPIPSIYVIVTVVVFAAIKIVVKIFCSGSCDITKPLAKV